MSASAPLVTSLVRPNGELSSRFLKTLHHELSVIIVPEMELTMKVAVLSAIGYKRHEIVKRLGVGDWEVRVAEERLRKMAESWV